MFWHSSLYNILLAIVGSFSLCYCRDLHSARFGKKIKSLFSDCFLNLSFFAGISDVFLMSNFDLIFLCVFSESLSSFLFFLFPPLATSYQLAGPFWGETCTFPSSGKASVHRRKAFVDWRCFFHCHWVSESSWPVASGPADLGQCSDVLSFQQEQTRKNKIIYLPCQIHQINHISKAGWQGVGPWIFNNSACGKHRFPAKPCRGRIR